MSRGSDVRSRTGRTALGALLIAGVGWGLAGCTAVTTDQPYSDPQIPLPSAAPGYPSPTAADPMDRAPAVPTARPGATVDAAAQAKADAWVAGARLPPGAVRVTVAPAETTIDDQSQGWWCAPMAHAEAYWTVPRMDLGHAGNWLRAHPSNGLHIVGPTHVAPDPAVTNDAVYDFPSPSAYQGMTFELASWRPGGTVIHLEVGVLATQSACATAAPGTELSTAGG